MKQKKKKKRERKRKKAIGEDKTRRKRERKGKEKETGQSEREIKKRMLEEGKEQRYSQRPRLASNAGIMPSLLNGYECELARHLSDSFPRHGLLGYFFRNSALEKEKK